MNILKRRYAELDLVCPMRIAGEFELRVYKSTGELKRQVRFKNLLTNAGLNRWVGTTDPPVTYVFVGTGTATPAFTDTTLATYKAGVLPTTSNTETNSGPPDYISTRTIYARFAPGVATGNITEVGTGWDTGTPLASNYTLFSRALIQDSGGSPTTITVLADEYLDIYYYIKYYPTLTDSTYDITVGGSPITVTQRQFNVQSTSKFSSSGLGNIGFSVSAYFDTSATLISNTTVEGYTSWVPDMTITYDSYVTNSFQRTGYAQVPTTGANMAIRSIFIQDLNTSHSLRQRRQLSLSAAVTKTNLQVLRLNQSLQVARYP